MKNTEPELQIQIHNFGPIHDFTFNVRDNFLLIVGENNVGKSYAISVVYLTLKALTAAIPTSYAWEFIDIENGVGTSMQWQKDFEHQVKNTPSNGVDIDITNIFLNHLKEFFQELFIPRLQSSLLGTFNDLANLQNKLSDEPASLTLRSGKTSVTILVTSDGLTVSNIDLDNHKFSIRMVQQNRTKLAYEKSTIIYFPKSNPVQFEGNYNAHLWRLFAQFVQSYTTEISEPHYLPASRSGLYQALSAFGQIVAELAKNRTMLSRKIELPGISEPLSDYFLKLSDARPQPLGDSPTAFQLIGERIENDILHGKVDFDTKSKRLTYSPHNVALRLDLSATSSMVSEISPIVSYLKFILPAKHGLRRRRPPKSSKHGQIIIIEEPEAHLHPEVQRRLIAIFAELVKTTGSKLVMTSHSNYIFNEASNLVISKEINIDTFRAVKFKRTDHGSTAYDLGVSQYGIEDDNFLDTAEAIYQERLDLLSKIDNNDNV